MQSNEPPPRKKHVYKAIMCVFACATISKYKDEILKIRETWYRRALENNMLVLFMLGEEPTDLVGDEYVYLPGVKNDYESASLKQNLGIKYIIDNYDYEYIHVCGTDTFLVIDNLVKLLETYESTQNIAIGGHGCHRNINGEKTYFLSGGPGIIISKSCALLLYEYLALMYEEWKAICIKDRNENLIAGCDVAISYYLQKRTNTRIIREDDKFFFCNFLGHPCHICEVGGDVENRRHIVACHLMSPSDFDNFQGILRQWGMA